MTPAELKRGIEALSIKLRQLEHGERIAYWHLMDLLDQGSPELSRALDGELHRLEATGELVFVEDEEGAESMVERRVAAKKKKPAAKKQAKPAPKKKKAAVKKKR
ncbi:MAG: hypothetical protein Q8L48_03465 [Archangium sp.]|nr:hypothetical protein [Archangium sp.]